jgi:hypothetical protein
MSALVCLPDYCSYFFSAPPGKSLKKTTQSLTRLPTFLLKNYTGGVRDRPTTREIANRTRNTKKSICAILLAAPAIPVKPKIAAIRAIIKKAIDQLNIFILHVES